MTSNLIEVERIIAARSAQSRKLTPEDLKQIQSYLSDVAKHKLQIALNLLEQRDAILDETLTRKGKLTTKNDSLRQGLDFYLRITIYAIVIGADQNRLLEAITNIYPDNLTNVAEEAEEAVQTLKSVAIHSLPQHLSKDQQAVEFYFDWAQKLLHDKMPEGTDGKDYTLTITKISPNWRKSTIVDYNEKLKPSDDELISNDDSGVKDDIQALRVLERRPLTVAHLKYALGLPTEKVHQVVKRLWNKGYIDDSTANIFRKIIPSSKRRENLASIDQTTYFTLTSKGYFHLHPVISFGKPEDMTK